MASATDDLLTAAKGAAMGAANVIPGVSGGTIAFITGIYERLINALKSCDLAAIKLLLGRRFKEFAEHVDLRFLLGIGIGAVVAIVGLAGILEAAFKKYPVPTWAFFFGLILASIWGVGKMVKRWDARAIVALAIGFAIAAGLLFLPHAQGNTNFVYLIFCGMAAISSMIIPGVSGSFVLLIMGNYVLVLSTVVALVDNAKSFNFGAEFIAALSTLFPFGIGCVLGLIVLSRVLAWIFRYHHDLAVALITGFIVGSLILIWPWKDPVYKQDADGAYLVKTEEREVLARAGDLDEVKAGLGEGEELLGAGYANWRIPSFAKLENWIAGGMAGLGIGIVLLIEWLGLRFRKPDELVSH